jgi:phage terminase small subunit
VSNTQTPEQRYAAALKPLEPREQRFVQHYLACLNKTKAAKLAGYSERSARSIGHENLTKPDIAAAVAAGMELHVMPPAEALARLSAQARGDMGDFLRVDEEEITLTWSVIEAPKVTDEMGGSNVDMAGLMSKLASLDNVTPTDRILQTATVKRAFARLDLQAAGEAGLLHLVKKYSLKDDGTVAIELYDAQKALELVGKHHGQFVERQELTGKGGAPLLQPTIREVVIKLPGVGDAGSVEP